MPKSDVLIIIPTLNGGDLFRDCVNALGMWKSRLVVFDSGSTDGTIDYLNENQICWVKVDPAKFNHGATREEARKLKPSSFVVYLTQDVILERPESLDKLLAPVVAGSVEIAYGRQLPRSSACFFERFPREFNYPVESHIRKLEDAVEFGAYTFFCSNSFAAYSQEALDKVGGFGATLSHEDYFAAARILKNGGAIAYVSEATVFHSHRYSLLQEFRRYFDAGYVRAVNPWVTRLVGAAENHGAKFFKSMLLRLLKKNPLLVPYAILQTASKWLGYRVGYTCFKSPTWIKRRLSGQSYYFDSPYYVPGEN